MQRTKSKVKALICLVGLVAALSFTSNLSRGAEERIGTVEQPQKTKKASDTCIQGYVWREARPNDHVCVKPEIRTAVAEQNQTRKQRWTSGAYGPQTCIQGYVWREAFSGDKVCVKPDFREQTKQDNKAAPRRVVK